MSDYVLYHYFERDFGPFMPLTALPMEEAKKILMSQRAAGKPVNPDIDGFLQKRYDRDKQLRDVFIAHGGQPKRTPPVYMMLGEHRQWESAYETPAVIKIPLKEFDRMAVSFTYGDSFAIFNPALLGEEEYWNRIYFADEIMEVIRHYGFPPHIEYDFKRGIYPKDKHINHHLKYVEAHVWDDEIISKYRAEWLAHNLRERYAADRQDRHRDRIVKRPAPALLIMACAVALSGLVACSSAVTDDARHSSDTPTTGSSAQAEPTPAFSETPVSENTTNSPLHPGGEDAEALRWPLTVDWNGPLIQTQSLTRQPLPVLDETRILKTLHTENVADGVKQVIYRARDAELPESDHFAYLEINDVRYDMGQINYGEDSYYASGENALKEMGKAFTPIAGIQGAELYSLQKTLGMKCNPTLLYEIVDQVPYVLGGEATEEVPFPGEMMNLLAMDTLENGIVEAIATDYGNLENDMTLYRFDNRGMELRTLSLKALLRCDEIQFLWDEARQTWDTNRYCALRYPEDWRERGQDWEPTLLGVFVVLDGMLIEKP